MSYKKHFLLSHVSAFAFCTLGSAANVSAAPEGGVVVGGAATIHQQPNYTEIQQQTDRAAINWKSFDIPANHHTHFAQPSSRSVALNRVTGSHDPSQIMGKLTANGTVALVNPNGIVFGKGAQVDVGGLIASTADIRNDDFMAGRDHYGMAGKPDASIVNHGDITIKEAGLAAFVAPNVQNHGSIIAHLGKVEMASADSFAIDLYGDGLYKLAISDEHAKQLMQHSGSIDASGGYVRLTAAQAKELVDSTLQISGSIDVSSVKGKGGTVEVSATDVQLSHTARIQADGKTGGGHVLIGGDFQGGRNPDIHITEKSLPNAQTTTVAKGASITANALSDGKGGTVIIWSDDTTRHQGNIEAKGGAQSGNGGFVEVSGKERLRYAGTNQHFSRSWQSRHVTA
jgi:filamentous hemagglutinin family protein